MVPGYDTGPRRWRNLDTCQFTTWIVADVPRVEYPTHGMKQIRVPWAEPGCRLTALFEPFAIDVLQEGSVQGGADLFSITGEKAWEIAERAVMRGLACRGHEVLAHPGVIEKAIAKRHRYLTVVADLDRSRLIYLAADRVRKAERRAVRKPDDDRLTGTKYLWSMRSAAMSPAPRQTIATPQDQRTEDGAGLGAIGRLPTPELPHLFAPRDHQRRPRSHQRGHPVE